MSVVQQVMQKSTDILRRIIAPVEWRGGVTLSYVCHHYHGYPLEDCIWWVSMEHGDSSNKGEKSVAGGARHANGQYNWKDPNEILVTQDSADPREARESWAHAPPLGPCENLMFGFELLANLQKGGSSPADSIFEGSHVQNVLKITNELRRVIEVDNHEAPKIGDLEKNAEAIKVVRPKINHDIFPHAAVR